MYLIPDYSQTESVWLIKFHHCFADGMGLMATMSSLGDRYDKDVLFDQCPKLTPFQKVLMVVTLPYFVGLMMFKSLFTLAVQNNAIKRGRPVVGIKHGAVTSDWSV